MRPKWRGVPKRRVFLHTISDISYDAKILYAKLSRTATGPGPIYLYKPLLHLVLPTWLSHVIVLDTDLFFFSDIRGLWEEFRHFGPTELLGEMRMDPLQPLPCQPMGAVDPHPASPLTRAAPHSRVCPRRRA